MNPADDQLNRLFRAASQARPDPSPVAPFGLEARVMAEWRQVRPAHTDFLDVTLLVRGLILASLIMTVSFWPILSKTTDPFSDYLQLADSTVPADEAP